ncbi:hypothetical protein ACIGCK_11080 [Microbacterium sp. NPDC078428]|uniref:hypothetical protein n=1 Tax=Microbacterium sp. NPDC078428 TaxID=3364190 RepID=UPI0037C87325
MTTTAILGRPRAPHGADLVPAGPSLWRVRDRTGLIVGHIESCADARGVRYSAKRFHAPSRAFRSLGEFWSADEAIRVLLDR